MTSSSDVRVGTEPQLRLDPGRQALLAHDSLQPPVGLLPPTAYENLLVVSPASPDTVQRVLEDAGADVDSIGQIPLSATDYDYDGPMWTSPVVEPSDLTGLSMRFSRTIERMQRGHGWVLFDDFNTLFLYSDSEKVIRLFDHLTERARDNEIRSVFTVVRDAMDDRTYARLCNTVDTEIDVR